MRYSKLRYSFLFFFLIIAMPGWGHALSITSGIEISLGFPVDSGSVLLNAGSVAEVQDTVNGPDTTAVNATSTMAIAQTSMTYAQASAELLNSGSKAYAYADLDIGGIIAPDFEASARAFTSITSLSVFSGNTGTPFTINYTVDYIAMLFGDLESAEMPKNFGASFSAYIEIYDTQDAINPLYRKMIAQSELQNLDGGLPDSYGGTMIIPFDGITAGQPYLVRLFAEANTSVSYKETETPAAPAPEPSTLFLAGTGIAVFGFWRRKKRA